MLIYKSYEILLIKRFLFSKKTDGFISIFSWFSIIGITIGVAAIIIVMSVMNGFRDELTKRLLGINGHLNIFSNSSEITIKEIDFLKTIEGDFNLIPVTQTQALLIADNYSQGVILKGYNNNFINDSHFLNQNIVEGSLFEESINDAVIGYALANKLSLGINDKFKIAIPKTDKTIFGNIPRFKTLNIIGIFDLGMYEYDSNFIFTNSKIANKLLLINETSFNEIEIFTKDPSQIEKIQEKINLLINKNNLNLYTFSWKEKN